MKQRGMTSSVTLCGLRTIVNVRPGSDGKPAVFQGRWEVPAKRENPAWRLACRLLREPQQARPRGVRRVGVAAVGYHDGDGPRDREFPRNHERGLERASPDRGMGREGPGDLPN